MRVIFAGTPEFARVALEAIAKAGHEIALVMTQPDRPSGRGMKLHLSPVKQFALDFGVEVLQTRSLRLDGKYPDEAAAAKQIINAANADVMIVAAYGLILPQWVLDTPRLGCLNIHASLLPRWRGAAPIHRAIEAGDSETGVTIMQMDAGLDTGAMLVKEAEKILPTDTTGELHDRLAVLGAKLVMQALDLAEKSLLEPVAQPKEGVTYASKIDKAESAIDWSQPAEVLARRIRAFNPAPGASTWFAADSSDPTKREAIKVWMAQGITSAESASNGSPGTIEAANSHGIDVRCAQGLLRITQLQRAGGKKLDAADFLRGAPLAAGMRFEAA